MKNLRPIPFISHYHNKVICGGEYNGYVAVPPTNKWHGCTDEETLYELNVHGGVTFSKPAYIPKDGRLVFCINSMVEIIVGEYLPNELLLLNGGVIPSDWWVIGFDTKQWGDTPKEWTKERTIEETLALYKQLV